MKQNQKRILGIDPGTTIVGYAVLEKKDSKPNLIEHGTIQTEPNIPIEDKLEEIYCDIIKIIETHKPTLIAIESLFFCNNAKTAIDVGQARGVILLAAKQKKLPILNFTPLQVKCQIVGNGNAKKEQVQKMVQAILKLESLPMQDDAADAIAIAMCGLDSKIINHKS
jgi:crossover junction endodeoxyribonuclease RuvC